MKGDSNHAAKKTGIGAEGEADPVPLTDGEGEAAKADKWAGQSPAEVAALLVEQLKGSSSKKKVAKAKPKPKAKACEEPPATPHQEAMPKAEPKAEPKAQPKAQQKAEPKAQQAEPKAQQKAAPKAQPKAQPKAERKAEPKAEPKAQQKAQQKAQPKAQQKGNACLRPPATPQQAPRKQKKRLQLLLDFPGVPTKARDPVVINGYRIFTDMTVSRWRVKHCGERKDKGFSFKHDPEENWQRLNEHILNQVRLS